MGMEMREQGAGDLRGFLADRDVLCPVCEYNLRGLTDMRCPECGTSIDLRRDPNTTAPLLVAVMGLILFVVIGTPLGVVIGIAGFGSGEVLVGFPGLVLAVVPLAALTWWNKREDRIHRFSRPVQVGVVFLCWSWLIAAGVVTAMLPVID